MHVVINLDKPIGITSQDAVTKVKKIFRAKKAGHAGTLDPLATGVLLVCLNEATKIAGYLSGLDKEYFAEIKLGERTDTYDSEGEVIEQSDAAGVTASDIEEALKRFRGDIDQVPPMYSAIKISGMTLHRLARKGVVIERPARKVNISKLEVVGYSPPFLKLIVACSTGTYIRSLAEDVGLALGVGAHITALRRLRVGDFRVEHSSPLDQLLDRPGPFLSIDATLSHLSETVLDGRDLALATHGTAIPVRGKCMQGDFLRLKDTAGNIFGIGVVRAEIIKVERLFNIGNPD